MLCIVVTCLLIFVLEPGGLAYQFLSWSPIVSTGLISYSLYLWHWPVLTLSRWTIGIHRETIPFQLLLIWLLACGRYWRSDLFLGQRNDLEKNHSISSNSSVPICNLFDDPAIAKQFPDGCGRKAKGSRSTPSIYILGDSQIEQFAPAITAFAIEHNRSVYGVWGNACAFPALSGIKAPHFNAISPSCQTAQKTIEKQIQPTVKPGDIVFIGSYLTNYFSQSTEVASGSVDSTRQTYLKKLIALAEALVARGASVVLYINGPRFDGLEGAIDGYCFPQWFKTNLDHHCEIPSQSFTTDRAKDFQSLYRWADGSRRFIFDGVHPSTCTSTLCKATHYKDEAHFRDYYANYLFREFIKHNPTLLPTPAKQAKSINQE